MIFLAMITTSVHSQADSTDRRIYLDKGSFRVLYDYSRLCPALVWWSITPRDLAGQPRKAGGYFTTEYALPKPRAKHSWLTGSSYQRGHLCPAADRKRTADVMRSTFVMSNVAPMLPQFNTGCWAQAEEVCRLAAIRFDSVVVYAGSLWAVPINRERLPSHIVIPDSFFRAVVIPKDTTLNIYWLFPSDAGVTPEQHFRVSAKKFRSSMRKYFFDYFNITN